LTSIKDLIKKKLRYFGYSASRLDDDAAEVLLCPVRTDIVVEVSNHDKPISLRDLTKKINEKNKALQNIHSEGLITIYADKLAEKEIMKKKIDNENTHYWISSYGSIVYERMRRIIRKISDNGSQIAI
jgi:hypothetical protein